MLTRKILLYSGGSKISSSFALITKQNLSALGVSEPNFPGHVAALGKAFVPVKTEGVGAEGQYTCKPYNLLAACTSLKPRTSDNSIDINIDKLVSKNPQVVGGDPIKFRYYTSLHTNGVAVPATQETDKIIDKDVNGKLPSWFSKNITEDRASSLFSKMESVSFMDYENNENVDICAMECTTCPAYKSSLLLNKSTDDFDL